MKNNTFGQPSLALILIVVFKWVVLYEHVLLKGVIASGEKQLPYPSPAPTALSY